MEKRFKIIKTEDIDKSCENCEDNSLINPCKILNDNPEYKKLPKCITDEKRDIFKEQHTCEKFLSKHIRFPIEVSNFDVDTYTYTLMESIVGKFVSVRLVGDKDKKTYLGLFLGDIPEDIFKYHDKRTKVLRITFETKPAMFVFDLNRIVYGNESWWKPIKNEKQLKAITDIDINNIWYVKALKQIMSK